MICSTDVYKGIRRRSGAEAQRYYANAKRSFDKLDSKRAVQQESISMMRQPLTTAELDLAIGGDASTARMQRLKRFVDWGLLPTFGAAQVGVGRSRLFSDEAISIAKVLDMMSELGMRVAGQSAYIRLVASDPELIFALNDLVQARREIT